MNKKWEYSGDVNCEHGGAWLYCNDLFDCSDLVAVVAVWPISDEHAMYLIDEGIVFISPRQDAWLSAINSYGGQEVIDQLIHYCLSGQTRLYWWVVTEMFMAYSGIERSHSRVVAIGRDAPDEANGWVVDYRLRSNHKLGNYIKREFLKGA